MLLWLLRLLRRSAAAASCPAIRSTIEVVIQRPLPLVLRRGTMLLLLSCFCLPLLLLDAASEGCPDSQGTFCAAPEFYIELQCHTEAVVIAAAVPSPPLLPMLLG